MKLKTKIILLILLVLVLVGTLCAIIFLRATTDNEEPRRINLCEGTTYEALCDSLQASSTFRLMAQTFGLDEHVRPGSYLVEPHMSELSLVRKLRNGQQDPIRLTIGKFRTPQQLNEYLNSKLMHNDFDISLDSFYLIRPNTYEFYWTVTPEKFMERMVDEYNCFWTKNIGIDGELRCDLIELSDFSDTRLETIIIASIVEEETNNNQEKPLIASVYLNRLVKGIPLQADPTVKYAVGDFTLKRILNKHLAADSPFNTYLHTGLPPAPICLPSEASVDAVLNAPQTQYLYFCASDKLDGTHRFATTLAEHNRNAAAFHKALNTRGIK